MTDIVDIASPQTTDEHFFTLLNKDGILKIYNYTIIDTPYVHSKYLKEIGIKRAENKTAEEIDALPESKKLKDKRVPSKFKHAM